MKLSTYERSGKPLRSLELPQLFTYIEEDRLHRNRMLDQQAACIPWRTG
jgi:hypothetical protein